MILEMTKVRLLGPTRELRHTLAVLQDLGTVHLVSPAYSNGFHPHGLTALEHRRQNNLQRALDDVEAAIEGLTALGAAPPRRRQRLVNDEGRIARLANHTRRTVDELRTRERALLDERDALRAYLPLVDAVAEVLASSEERRFSAYLLMLRGSTERALVLLRDGLDRELDGEYELRVRNLQPDTTALLLLVPSTRAQQVDGWMGDSGVEPAPIPLALGDVSLVEALPRMRPRLVEVDRELRLIRQRARDLAHQYGIDLTSARHQFHDELIELAAHDFAVETSRAFVLEGWVPAREVRSLREHVSTRLRAEISLTELSRNEWQTDEAPVVLANPSLFEPFERVTRLLPLPHYGTVDPTPFVAVFFPMFFGVVVGDVGYGLVIAILATIMRLRSKPGGLARDVSRMAGAIAVFTVVFGVLYGELFGDLGRRAFGLRALWFDREDAVMPFLVLAIALGAVHLLLGLLVSAVSRRHSHPRKALGSGITLAMMLLIAVALLAVFELLPVALFTPAVVALLVAFPILVIVEGFTAPLELLSMVGHVLSYARVMALGTASVMLAVVANRMVGAIGSVAVGVLFALLFHLVNFAITLFSPTIHILRLHYVEFFGTFYSPGGARYQPLAHWTPEPATGR